MYPKQNASSKQKRVSWDLQHLLIWKQNLDLKLYFFLFSFEHFCAAVQTSMLIWKSNIIYSEGELTWLWFPSICKETKENCHLKKKIKNQGSEVQVTLPRAHSCLDTGPVSAGDGEEHPSVHGRRGNSLRCLWRWPVSDFKLKTKG